MYHLELAPKSYELTLWFNKEGRRFTEKLFTSNLLGLETSLLFQLSAINVIPNAHIND
jgi:hypothetical protein